MKLEDCMRYVAELLPGLLWAYQVQGWEVNLRIVDDLPLNEDGSETTGQVFVYPLYERATIEIDPDRFATKAALAKTLRHEVAHILHADIERSARIAWDACAGKRARAILERVYFDAAEQLVGKIERMFDVGLGLKPLQLARRGRDRRNRTLKEDRP